MARLLARATALVALVGVSACSRGSDAHDSVAAAELQKTIIAKLAQAGTPSTWVNCSKDLPGTVGATTRCDVKFSSDNSVTALLTTTRVEGGRVDWEITRPELTKDQVAKRVAGLTSAQGATCDWGLDGQTGDWVQCQVTRFGAKLNQTVKVTSIKGLAMDLNLTQMLPKQQVEELLVSEIGVKSGLRPDSAECPGDLNGESGVTMKCAATTGANSDTYLLTVTGVSPGMVNFEYAPTAADASKAAGT